MGMHSRFQDTDQPVRCFRPQACLAYGAVAMGLIDGDSCECYNAIPPNEAGAVRESMSNM